MDEDGNYEPLRKFIKKQMFLLAEDTLKVLKKL
jgi:hypothetical protein